MRLVVLAFSIFAGTFLLAAAAEAQQQNVSVTKHNLASSEGEEICAYCHTPHAAEAATPLWNRALPGQTFSTYSSPSGFYNDISGGQPGMRSLVCLSCHDGTQSFDSVLNAPGTGSAGTGLGNTSSLPLVGGNNLAAVGASGDLSDDHPIGISLNSKYSGTILPTFNGFIECATCHNPHTTESLFLRMNNTASAVCQSCHAK